MKTIHEQREERRQVKLKHLQRQVKAGKLVVRQMTEEERSTSIVFPRRVGAPDDEGC
jgi:hypothetical protein